MTTDHKADWPGHDRRRKGSLLLAKYGPAPAVEEIDENRKEMFHGFAQD